MRNRVSKATGVAAAALGVLVVASSIIGGFILASGVDRPPVSNDSTVNVSNDQGGAPDDDDADEPPGTGPARHDDGRGSPSPEGPSASGSAGECADDEADHEAGDDADDEADDDGRPAEDDDGPESEDEC